MPSFVGGMPFPHIEIKAELKTSDGKPIGAGFKQALDRLVDLSPALRAIFEHIIKPSVEKSFAMGGRPQWRFHGYQSNPPMVKTGMMKNALLNPGQNSQLRVTKDSLLFMLEQAPFITARRQRSPGAKYDYFYPEAHQYGTEKHYQNLVLNLQPEDIDAINDAIAAYLADGTLP